MKKVALVSLGCSKNLVDSELITGSLLKSGNKIVPEDEAEVIIVNTCGFIGDAKKESINTALELLEYKKKGNCKKFIMTGCLVERYKDELKKEMPEIDDFWGTGNLFNIGSLLEDENNEPVSYEPGTLYDPDSPRQLLTDSHTSYLKVSEGCSRKCTFCIIPKMRGLMKSRPVESIRREIESLGERGVKEINLLAQDMTSYGRDIGTNLENLLKEISKVKSIEWLRLHYLYPWGVTDNLIDIINGEEKILPYIDMPLQHINDRILKLMDRRTTTSKTMDIIERLRTGIDDLTLRSTFIVGFPGETDKEYLELLEFLKEVKFDRAGAFKYSLEEGTKAALLEKQIPERIKDERFEKLMDIQSEVSYQKNTELIGRTFDALVEADDEEIFARISSQAPEIDGITHLENSTQLEKGSMVKVKITDVDVYDLHGTVIN